MDTLIVALIIVAVLWKLGILGMGRHARQRKNRPRSRASSYRPRHTRTNTHTDTNANADSLEGDQVLLMAGWVCAGLWYTSVMGGDPSCLLPSFYGIGLTLDQ